MTLCSFIFRIVFELKNREIGNEKSKKCDKYVVVSSQHQVDVKPKIKVEKVENEKSASGGKQQSVEKSNHFLDVPKSVDEDTNYLLSLIGYFRRMPIRKKAVAKLRILEYLTELEINGYDNSNSILDL